ncbi:Six-hairpin glycosidase [Dacryopinax primogenitus]|uniref:Six-hairpin glycosidase n=1 Tax=Dacryopinax primogenitus (strain DJM 731) TaxID=1858805 RepID=M5FQ53_DACPD|nr:Six-hairpin glycosidase [Dacryopinax primogenitus]EJT96734.1 Six-hairpin glycosidase [Dacryopinax primogenitus]
MIRSAMLGSIRTSWEQGTASHGLMEFDSPQFSVFGGTSFPPGPTPFTFDLSAFPVSTIQLAVSAVTRQSADGRLSQVIGDGLDGAALDGASAGSAVLLGSLVDQNRHTYFLNAANAQLNYVLNVAPRMPNGAISHRAASREYWADGVYMGFPFIAYYGAVTKNQTLLQTAYEQCMLYREALFEPNYGMWGHIYSADTNSWSDEGIWASGNGWAALGMLLVARTIETSAFGSQMTNQTTDLQNWIKEILIGAFNNANSDDLLPDYFFNTGVSFSDASASGAIAAAAYRAMTLWPSVFPSHTFLNPAEKIFNTIVPGVDELGLVNPVVDPLNWSSIGTVSTEAQAFALMMSAAKRAYDSKAGLADVVKRNRRMHKFRA